MILIYRQNRKYTMVVDRLVAVFTCQTCLLFPEILHNVPIADADIPRHQYIDRVMSTWYIPCDRLGCFLLPKNVHVYVPIHDNDSTASKDQQPNDSWDDNPCDALVTGGIRRPNAGTNDK